MTPKTLRRGALASGVILLSGVMIRGWSQSSAIPWSSIDSWFNPAKSPAAIRSQEAIWEDEKRYQVPFREVAASEESRAEQALKTKSCLRLSPGQARFLTSGSYPKTKTAPYLVRAVYLNRETGGFNVNLVGGNLFVRHGSLGSYPVPMQRQALIVNLPEAPRNVYVDCSRAQ